MFDSTIKNFLWTHHFDYMHKRHMKKLLHRKLSSRVLLRQVLP